VLPSALVPIAHSVSGNDSRAARAVHAAECAAVRYGPYGYSRRGGLTAVSLLIEPGLDAAGFHPHELRHTYASLAIASCPDIKTIQNALGHKSATQTLDQYGHLFGDRLDLLADAMDAARTSALANGQEMGSGCAIGTGREIARIPRNKGFSVVFPNGIRTCAASLKSASLGNQLALERY
jgi:hypothetical protein